MCELASSATLNSSHNWILFISFSVYEKKERVHNTDFYACSETRIKLKPCRIKMAIVCYFFFFFFCCGFCGQHAVVLVTFTKSEGLREMTRQVFPLSQSFFFFFHPLNRKWIEKWFFGEIHCSDFFSVVKRLCEKLLFEEEFFWCSLNEAMDLP